MSNELTPQEQYPKFYSHPHYWINAIEVYKNGDDFNHELTHAMFGEISECNNWNNYKPLFKPQEGEAFIKDLEAAVSAGGNGDFKLLSNRLGYKWFITDASDNFHTHLYLTVKDSGISVVSSYANFDTTAYVDKLRELGYYL